MSSGPSREIHFLHINHHIGHELKFMPLGIVENEEPEMFKLYCVTCKKRLTDIMNPKVHPKYFLIRDEYNPLYNGEKGGDELITEIKNIAKSKHIIKFDLLDKNGKSLNQESIKNGLTGDIRIKKLY